MLATLLLAACGGGGGSSSPPAKYTVGGTVSGLAQGNAVTLQNNGGESIIVTSNSPFTFATPGVSGSSYAVTIAGQPTGQQCSLTLGAGTLQSSNVNSVQVNCVALTYTVGGTVTGLSPDNVVTLQNYGGDTRTVSSNASFTFATAIAFGSAYSVSVSGQPTEQICTVSAGSGTMGAANVTNIQVNCVVKTYTIGGTISGLQPGNSVVLLDNGGDAATVSSNGAFTFATGLIKGAAYNVTVGTQPSGQNCFVFGDGSGTVATSNVANVVVQCPFVRTLYTFGATADDGSGPEAGVILGSDGNLYGVTAGGGPNWVNTGNNLGAGIFFKLTPAGAETVTWNFGAGMDGQNPSGDLAVDAGGNFYGTATAGGLYGDGTVFKMTPTGQETVLWNFGSGTDGQQPFGSVVLGQDGNLYGTTTAGGTYGLGTVFRLTPAGVESVLWSFGATGDGQAPKNRLIQGSDGNLYGTTESGGAFGYGTVYQLTLAGAETVLYSFADGADGQGPEGVVEGPDGALYGITIGGGTYTVGTAFKVTKGGVETILWAFGNGSDGRNPIDPPLFGLDGNLYGVTDNGGLNGLGTVYRLTPSGTETVLWSFKGTDGEAPVSTLTQGPDGTIYGTTYRGGTPGGSGYGGTVFELTM
jgi:uncharacterized repeat protein (TIGR03803 family)